MSYGFHYFKNEPLPRVAVAHNKLIDLVNSQAWKDDDVDVSKRWILTHSLTVAQLARLLALKRGQNAELACLAALLHDIYVIKTGYEKDHAINGYEPAKQFLEETRLFKTDEVAIISEAIKHHSEKKLTGNWLEEIVKDADVLDCTLHGTDFSAFEHHYERVKKLEIEFGLKIS